MLESVYHMTLKLLQSHFWSEFVKILLPFTQGYNGRH